MGGSESFSSSRKHQKTCYLDDDDRYDPSVKGKVGAHPPADVMTVRVVSDDPHTPPSSYSGLDDDRRARRCAYLCLRLAPSPISPPWPPPLPPPLTHMHTHTSTSVAWLWTPPQPPPHLRARADTPLPLPCPCRCRRLCPPTDGPSCHPHDHTTSATSPSSCHHSYPHPPLMHTHRHGRARTCTLVMDDPHTLPCQAPHRHPLLTPTTPHHLRDMPSLLRRSSPHISVGLWRCRAGSVPSPHTPRRPC